jgi:hypothetical protein
MSILTAERRTTLNQAFKWGEFYTITAAETLSGQWWPSGPTPALIERVNAHRAEGGASPYVWPSGPAPVIHNYYVRAVFWRGFFIGFHAPAVNRCGKRGRYCYAIPENRTDALWYVRNSAHEADDALLAAFLDSRGLSPIDQEQMTDDEKYEYLIDNGEENWEGEWAYLQPYVPLILADWRSWVG